MLLSSTKGSNICKRQIQNTSKTTGDLIGNKIADNLKNSITE